MMSFFDIIFSLWTIFIIVILYILYKWSVANNDHFHKKGIPFQRPIPLLGNSAGVLLHKKSIYDAILFSYNEYKGKRYAVFNLLKKKTIGIIIKYPL